MNTELTAAQKQTVETVGKSICVSAGAGTGKTRVLVERFIYLIERGLARPSEILAITFTEKAANEMKRRIAEALRERSMEEARRELESAYIGTIHSFCSRLLREHPLEAGVDPEFRVIEEDETRLIQEQVLDALLEREFEKPSILNFLSVYGEDAVRKGILHAHEKLQGPGKTIKDLSSFTHIVDEKPVKKSLESSLEHLEQKGFKAEACREAREVLSKTVSDWKGIEALKELKTLFSLRTKSMKEEIAAFRGFLEQWILIQTEHLSGGSRDSFLELVSSFERQFESKKRERSFLDFQDLEREAVQLLSGKEARCQAVRNLYRERFKFVMIDEFQDTSGIQNELIRLLSREDNLFIVGDWKQSIYGFRGADIGLFFEHEERYQKSENGIWLELIENFRSRAELIDFINPFFKMLWEEQRKTSLFLSAASLSPVKKIPSLELLAIEGHEEDSREEIRIREARTLALRIQELAGSGHFNYRDFAMLFRAGTDMHLYEYELRRLAIPYYVVSGRGFYEQPEIRDLMQALEFIENPHLDIPLAALLRSPLVQISDDALFWLADNSKRKDKSIPFYHAVINFQDIKSLTAEDRNRLARFQEVFGLLLEQKEKKNVVECLEWILEQTGYGLYVLGLPSGKRHFANIRKLIELARELGGRQAVHLGDFIRFVKNLGAQEVRESEAQVEAEEGNVVKLLTIHKAKGLEYKAVILPDLNRKIRDDFPRFLMHPEYGIGIKAWNEESFEFEETDTYQRIKDVEHKRHREESKRLLYVAMTRAREHLIFSGAAGVEKNVSETDKETKKPGDWFEWVFSFLRECGEKVHFISETGLLANPGRRRLALAERKPIYEKLGRSENIRIKPLPEAEEIAERIRPLPVLRFDRIDLPVSAFVTFDHNPEEYRQVYELGALREENEKPEEWNLDEDEESLNAADFGTLVHQVFEHLVSSPAKAHDRLAHMLKRFSTDFNRETLEEVKKLSVQFLHSKTFENIQNAKSRFPEIPFVLRLKWGIIQGTLDLLYERKDGGWVIVDYKTSNMEASSPEALGAHYRTQMMMYALAAYELLHLTVQNACLYFVRTDQLYEYSFKEADFKKLREEFENTQKQILA